MPSPEWAAGAGDRLRQMKPGTIPGNVGNPMRPKKSGGRKAVCGAWGVGLLGVQEEELRTCAQDTREP